MSNQIPGYFVRDIIDLNDPMTLKILNDNFKYIKLKIFGNLLDEDIDSFAQISGNKIKANSITADQIEAGTITANEIDTSTLIVGDNIQMGPNAKISWNNVNDKPFIPSQYTDSQALSAIRSTYIDVNGVWTPKVYAENIVGTMIKGREIQSVVDIKNQKYIYMHNQWLEFYQHDGFSPYLRLAIGFSGNTPLIQFYDNNMQQIDYISCDTSRNVLYMNKSPFIVNENSYLATKSWVQSQGYSTQHIDTSNFATQGDINILSSYISDLYERINQLDSRISALGG